MHGRPADSLRLAVVDRGDGADVGAIGEYALAAQTMRVGLQSPETRVHRAQVDRTCRPPRWGGATALAALSVVCAWMTS